MVTFFRTVWTSSNEALALLEEATRQAPERTEIRAALARAREASRIH